MNCGNSAPWLGPGSLAEHQRLRLLQPWPWLYTHWSQVVHSHDHQMHTLELGTCFSHSISSLFHIRGTTVTFGTPSCKTNTCRRFPHNRCFHCSIFKNLLSLTQIWFSANTHWFQYQWVLKLMGIFWKWVLGREGKGWTGWIIKP